MAQQKISEVIEELTRIKEREGDIPATCEGFFGECGGVKYHLREKASDGRYWSPYTHKEEQKLGKVIQISHL